MLWKKKEKEKYKANTKHTLIFLHLLVYFFLCRTSIKFNMELKMDVSFFVWLAHKNVWSDPLVQTNHTNCPNKGWFQKRSEFVTLESKKENSKWYNETHEILALKQINITWFFFAVGSAIDQFHVCSLCCNWRF